MNFRTAPYRLATALIAATLVSPVVQADRYGQARGPSSKAQATKGAPARSEDAAPTEPVLFPAATRAVPPGKASSKHLPKLQTLTSAEVLADPARVRALADALIALPDANAYERAFAAQVAVQATVGKDNPAALAYAQTALGANALDNNLHYQLLYLAAQLQSQQQQYAESIVTLDRFFTETGSQQPEQLATKATALYRLKRYTEAEPLLLRVLAATPTPRPDWQQLLMATYNEMGRPADAARVAQSLAAAAPGDKTAQMNLVALYLQGGETTKAIDILERMRGAGQLSTDNEYRQLFAAYANTAGKERQTIAVIEDGLAKGVLKSDFPALLALAQSYYFSDQLALAVGAYQKAAPLAPDGETYLNLAKLLQQEGRIDEARQAAQQALTRGVGNADAARRILAADAK